MRSCIEQVVRVLAILTGGIEGKRNEQFRQLDIYAISKYLEVLSNYVKEFGLKTEFKSQLRQFSKFFAQTLANISKNEFIMSKEMLVFDSVCQVYS